MGELIRIGNRLINLDNVTAIKLDASVRYYDRESDRDRTESGVRVYFAAPDVKEYAGGETATTSFYEEFRGEEADALRQFLNDYGCQDVIKYYRDTKAAEIAQAETQKKIAEWNAAHPCPFCSHPMHLFCRCDHPADNDALEPCGCVDCRPQLLREKGLSEEDWVNPNDLPF